ncbi:MAG: ARMT1-like domain-containing protein [Dehalococcoidales bacterium]|nr:ARMT1-like domain-containing protein [Dehalococcoidales bacterium]
MKTRLDCIPCFFRQALGVARATTDDINIHRRVLNEVAGLIPELPLEITPPEIAQRVYRLTYQITGNNDPYQAEKRKANERALALYPYLKKTVADSDEPLLTASKLAIGGNSIDLGPTSRYAAINSIIAPALADNLSINDYEILCNSINESRRILYLGDNAGEILFDRILIEEIKQIKDIRVDFVVRESPIINDATMTDARYVGLDRVANLISSGSDAPATVLSQCSDKILELYYAADMIIAKGQGNFESLSEEEGNIFFLLKAKCDVIAKILEVGIGGAVLKKQTLSLSHSVL